MGAEPTPLRAVLDTNVVVSALLFGGRLGRLRDAWQSGRLKPLVNRHTVDELIRVLAYPKFRLAQEEIETLLADFLPFAETVEPLDGPPETVPVCDDPDDQGFLVLAAASGADALVTGDADLLDLASEAAFEILTASDLSERLGAPNDRGASPPEDGDEEENPAAEES